jgi:tetratricopeptide (TPR) repeat protein
VNDPRVLTRLVWLVFGLLIVVSAAFGGYYYYDRYVHVGDQTPAEKMVSVMEAKVRAEPNSPGPRLALAEAYLQERNYDQALAQAQQVLQNYPEAERAHLVIGLTYAFSGKTEQSLAPLEKYADLRRKAEMKDVDQSLELALYYLGDGYLKLQRPADAIKVLNEAVGINRTDADALLALGRAYNLSGQPQEAVNQLTKAVGLVPDFTEAYAEMAVSYGQMNKPDHIRYADGMQAFAKKDYNRAQGLLAQAAAALPDFAPVQLGLGLTYEQLGDLAKAKASLERAVALDPHDFSATHALQRVNSTK